MAGVLRKATRPLISRVVFAVVITSAGANCAAVEIAV